MGVKWKYVYGLDSEDPSNGPFGVKSVKLPNVATASLPTPAAANEGNIVYDATSNTVKFSDGSSWTNIASAGATPTADQVYNAGAWAVTVDAGSCTFASNQAAANVLVLTEANAANTGNIIDITNAGTGKDIDGTSSTWYVTKTGAATFASATIPTLNVTTASITNLTLGAVDGFTLTGNCAFTSTATTGNGLQLDGSSVTTGNILNIEADAVALNGGYYLNCTLDTVSKFRVAEDGSVTIAGTAAGSNAIAVTAGDLTLTSGHLAMVSGNATLTSGTLTLVDGSVDITCTSGDLFDLIPVATGAVADINLPAGYNLASGAIDIDGSTGSGPVIAVNFSGAYTGGVLVADMTNAVGANALTLTGAGVRTAGLIVVTDTPSSVATFDLNITPAGAAANANVFDIDIAGTGSANVIDIDFAGAYTGDALNINMTNAVGANAMELTGAGSRTVPLCVITDVPADGAATFDLNVTGGHANGHTFDIDEAGTSTNNCFNWDCSGAYNGDVINITMANAAATAQAIVVDGSLAASSGIVSFTSSGALANTGSILDISSTGNLAAANTSAVLKITETGNAQATSYAAYIASTNNEALLVDTGKSRFDEEVTFKQSNRNFVHPNYIAAGGVNNAITGTLTDADGANVPLADGLVVLVDLQALTLQAGVNTFDFNGGGALSIVSHYNVAANIGSAYAAQSHVMLCYNAGATVWEDMSQ